MEFVAKGKSALQSVLDNPKVTALMENPEVSFRLLSPEGEFLIVSRGVEGITGYTPEEYVKKKAQDIMHPGDHDVAMEGWKAMAEGPVEVVTRAYHKEGHVFWGQGHGMMVEGGMAFAVRAVDEPPQGAYWRRIPAFL